ncbi:MAG: tyrosine-type recombinase/integrase [Deltaproteobacteria bacterium]|nr:tyrosine-type recombinase/integrase [Deltaproteobacteria bacterium]
MLEDRLGRPVDRFRYVHLLRKLAQKLPNAPHLTPHMLRHTFATSLMSGGMSMPGIMKVLGHKDHKMTLRYTAISDDTVCREYLEALSRVAERYALHRESPGASTAETDDPVAAITYATRWMMKHLCFGAFERPRSFSFGVSRAHAMNSSGSRRTRCGRRRRADQARRQMGRAVDRPGEKGRIINVSF